MKYLPALTLALLTSATLAAQVATTPSNQQIETARAAVDSGLVLQGSYGIARLDRTDLTGEYAQTRELVLHLGWRGSQAIEELDIPGLRQTTIFLASSVGEKSETKIHTEASRFGLRTASGYGWASPAGMFLPYSSSAMVWTKLDVAFSTLPEVDRAELADFHDTRRYGTSVGAGLELVTDDNFSIRAGATRTMVYPRHLVFKEMVSSIIQGGIADAVGMASARMIGSKGLSPAVSWILSTAIRYGISKLRREEMNWPFESAPPLIYDGVEVSVSHTF